VRGRKRVVVLTRRREEGRWCGVIIPLGNFLCPIYCYAKGDAIIFKKLKTVHLK
jgi:hypothetical protein